MPKRLPSSAVFAPRRAFREHGTMAGDVRMVVVAEAEDALEATIWVDALRDAGVVADSFERGVGSALGGAVAFGAARFPVVVRSTDFVEARGVITDLGGAQRLAPFRSAEEERAKAHSALMLVAAIAAAVAIMAVVTKLA